MEQRKLNIIEKIEQKGLSTAELAEAISFNPTILGLYLVKDAYPAPTRILDKVEASLAD
jgi:ribosome-binding protein aMBF1 (putative translation factor)